MTSALKNNTSNIAACHAVVKARADAAISQHELFQANTGWQQSSEQYRESATKRALLLEQTKQLATALEGEGISAWQEDSDLIAIGEVTGQIDRIDGFRSICFLPTVAQRDRRQILNGLMYFQNHHKLGRFLRMAVVTAGDRIPLGGELRKTMQKLHRDVSRWAHEADKLWNIAVIYRGSEFTYDTDTKTFHPHANVLYAPRKALKGDKWARFLSWSHQRLGAHWKDCGKLDKPQEAIKYPFKPAELEALNGPELAWLFHATYRLKIAQPMKEFKYWREELVYRVAEHDRINPFTGEVKTVRVREKRDRPLKVGFIKTISGAKLHLIEKAPRKKTAPNEHASATDEALENIIVCRLSPQFRFSPYAEPVTMIMNYTPDPVTVDGKERLQEIKARKRQARRYWDANGAPDPRTAVAVGKAQRAASEGEAQKVRAFNVHTSRSTVQTQQDNLSKSLPTERVSGTTRDKSPAKPGNYSPNHINQTLNRPGERRNNI